MRIMLDTNVLISMILFPSDNFSRMMECISQEHTMVLSSFVVDELLAVVDRKFPSRKAAIERFLSVLRFELVYTPKVVPGGLFSIRDEKDYPVLYTAIVEGVDVLVTGDKDFGAVDVDRPEILTPSAFVEKYASDNTQ